MLRGFLFGLGLLSGTMLCQSAFAGASALQIIVSKDKQSLTVYEGDHVIATSKVSTGKAGHTTPSGIFSILEKRKYHESNIYSDAPMPWMQRLTWSGIALHEGNVPAYPASHGCVRLPAEFARSLYRMTDRGAHVIIADAPVEPYRVESDALFMPRQPSMLPDVQLRTASIQAKDKPVEVAMNVAPNNPMHDGTASDAPAGTAAAAEGPPLRILITRRGERETIRDAQAILQMLGFETGGTDGFVGPLTRDAVAGFKRWKNLPTSGALMSNDFLAALYQSAGQPLPPKGQIMVRQNFKPLFEAPVDIRQPELALGTHLLTVQKVDAATESAEWRAISLPNALSPADKKRLGITTDNQAIGEGAAKAALERIDMPTDIRQRIEAMLTEGSSVTINDQGMGAETGNGTDFVTVTRSATAPVEPVSTKARPARERAPKLPVNGIGLY